MPSRLLMLVVVASLAALPSAGQDLAAAAAREKQRRDELAAKRKQPPLVITEETLAGKQAPVADAKADTKKTGAKPSPSPSPSPSPTDPGDLQNEQAQRESLRTVWANQAQERRQAIAAAQQKVDDLAARVARANVDLNPTSNVMDPFRRQSLEAEVAKLKTELEAAQQVLQDAKDAWTALEDEARKNRVPPGWIR